MTAPFRRRSSRPTVGIAGRVGLAAFTIMCTVAFTVACGGAPAGAAPAPAMPNAEAAIPVDAALAAAPGEVEQTTFADDLNVVLLAMTRLPTGIYFRDIEPGTGVVAAPGREVLMSYIAYLANGTEVDRTAPGARPLAFKVGDGVVIRGWDLGVRGMRVGGTRQLVVPSRFAYGPRAVGKIPPNSVMVFVVRLDGVR
jgi:FKBP-type peptidyl-prolyl cis-trans isomerase